MTEPSLEDLQQEVDVLRAELAAVRAEQEAAGEREAKLRQARDRATKVSGVLSSTLAERLMAETSVAAADRPRWRRGSAAITPEEAGELELIRRSSLFDAAWYLRNHHDVARRGEDPSLHFLRHWSHPFRKPSEDFDIAQYVLDHPEVVSERINPLVHFLGSPQSDGADSYPPRSR